MYDVARRDTFENLDLWLQEVEVYSPAGGRDVVKLLVGNKIDKVRRASLYNVVAVVDTSLARMCSQLLARVTMQCCRNAL